MITARVVYDYDRCLLVGTVLATGATLEEPDPRALADWLFAAGVRHGEVSMPSHWQEGVGDSAPPTGDKIALNFRLNRLERANAPIVFLDFDGVLHPFADRHSRAFCDLPRLEAVIRDAPRAGIVITSTQREDQTLLQLRTPFSPDVAERVIDVTPVLPMHSAADLAGSRHREILAYLEARPGSGPWLAVDDDAALYPAGLPNLLLCEDGFRAREAAQLASWLSDNSRITTVVPDERCK
ncbi:HAD domain-containing protein [Paraburkholderia caribensis]|uniref:HAD domain-containing protein n=1 Tax=Paraburkholderia caribensis TaxID=75105 RepID=UPI0028633196|nr:HAD domain-containing protein [Paraburkholderia caribensis]MDR6382142.1 hypothetical protein [Paraburkholderia caribensis]